MTSLDERAVEALAEATYIGLDLSDGAPRVGQHDLVAEIVVPDDLDAIRARDAASMRTAVALGVMAAMGPDPLSAAILDRRTLLALLDAAMETQAAMQRRAEAAEADWQAAEAREARLREAHTLARRERMILGIDAIEREARDAALAEAAAAVEAVREHLPPDGWAQQDTLDEAVEAVDALRKP